MAPKKGAYMLWLWGLEGRDSQRAFFLYFT